MDMTCFGELVIEQIELDTYILDSTESTAMENYPVKLYGNEINQIGNFCIAGHNYESIFARLTELSIGDTFYIVDQDDVIQDYIITDISQVDPTDLTCLMPTTDSVTVTLITCEDGATTRLVIKAERVSVEVESDEEATENTDAETESET